MSSINTNERCVNRLPYQRDVGGLIGIPYQYGGSSHNGCDCWGLVVYYYKQLGISLPDFLRPSDHEKTSQLNIVEMATPYFRKIDIPTEQAIVVGKSISSLSFGVWEAGGILTTFYGKESRLVSWDVEAIIRDN
jgi:hypothetical protein